MMLPIKSQFSRPLSFKFPRLPRVKLEDLKLKPQPPGNIVGTVNDAYVPPAPNEYHGSYHWAYERIVTLGMAPLMLAPFVGGVEYPLVDAGMGMLLLWHCKAGFQSCIIDYIPLRVYGIWHKLAMGLLSAGTWLALYGLYVVETEQNGLCNIIYSLWQA
ncbi:hypothetical protein KL905_000141 [Ogataea polymorpha]|uniref:Succinate dehydrogenase [ubiquinone] cytochrome b small subunit n=2 Tax=Ogataea polymorpha TaxID=460523 RepID=A0A9P8P1T8_9ASCO|nr:hypothetical protein KL937_000935 [Ogataea polymorpha]KAG7894904.1 hypothetical protein KL908_001254 [Ogataea polymorpha]KAG7902613.1 hypothetical protein KL935_001521 [Ogataea polymorpha]KAG7911399.1 hypothetical protein KL906_000720 [Ogataea polymorpha]KAG7912768.1 hypothetical protein KL907_000970 [Ogataea polymorpha]